MAGIIAQLHEYATTKNWKTLTEYVTGIIGYSYKNQKQFDEFVRAWEKDRENKLALTKNKRPRKKKRTKKQT